MKTILIFFVLLAFTAFLLPFVQTKQLEIFPDWVDDHGCSSGLCKRIELIETTLQVSDAIYSYLNFYGAFQGAPCNTNDPTYIATLAGVVNSYSPSLQSYMVIGAVNFSIASFSEIAPFYALLKTSFVKGTLISTAENIVVTPAGRDISGLRLANATYVYNEYSVVFFNNITMLQITTSLFNVTLRHERVSGGQKVWKFLKVLIFDYFVYGPLPYAFLKTNLPGYICSPLTPAASCITNCSGTAAMNLKFKKF